MSTRAERVRTRPRANEGSTLVLLHPGEVPIAELAGHLVAVLFAAASPLAFDDVTRVLELSAERLEEVCALLCREPPTGLALQRHADQLQLITSSSSAAVVERFLGAPPAVRLSRAALEALAVIAYRQPVTRGEIDAVRGVNSDSAVSTLLTRSLVAEVGRRETVGRPALLAVTTECLQYLGIRSLDELPDLPPHAGAAAAAEAANAEDALAEREESTFLTEGDPGDELSYAEGVEAEGEHSDALADADPAVVGPDGAPPTREEADDVEDTVRPGGSADPEAINAEDEALADPADEAADAEGEASIADADADTTEDADEVEDSVLHSASAEPTKAGGDGVGDEPGGAPGGADVAQAVLSTDVPRPYFRRAAEWTVLPTGGRIDRPPIARAAVGVRSAATTGT